MLRPIYNLHNHTPFSDGAYTIDEVAEAHVSHEELDIAGIGICDHLFCTPSSREPSDARDFERIFAGETRRYVEAVHEARDRWAGKLDIVCGCEINWPMNKAYFDVIRKMLDGIDYVLFEYLDWAALTQLANQARHWPCPVGLAHADVTVQFPNTSADQVVRTLANARIFYEINSKFLPLHENDKWFNLLPNHRVSITLGTDTHDDLSCIDDLKTMHAYAVARGLEQKLFVPRLRENEADAAESQLAAQTRP